jgi:hypothetical protein
VEDNTIMVGGERMLPAHCNATQAEVLRCMRAHPGLRSARTAAATAVHPATCSVKKVRVELAVLYNAFRVTAEYEDTRDIRAMVGAPGCTWVAAPRYLRAAGHCGAAQDAIAIVAAHRACATTQTSPTLPPQYASQPLMQEVCKALGLYNMVPAEGQLGLEKAVADQFDKYLKPIAGEAFVPRQGSVCHRWVGGCSS